MPALASTRTSAPTARNRSTESGTIATRRSPGTRSLRTPTVIVPMAPPRVRWSEPPPRVRSVVHLPDHPVDHAVHGLARGSTRRRRMHLPAVEVDVRLHGHRCGRHGVEVPVHL